MQRFITVQSVITYTLTKSEISLMVNDIIPNQKDVPNSILQKAVNHANKRVREGKSIFADEISPERVRVVSPDGREGTVPADKVDELPEGWKKL